jgi:VWFA-related protein
MSLRRVIPAAVVCALLAVATVFAQQKPTFKSGVEVVLLDVNVVDAAHVPVSDLEAEDFLIAVDGKPRKVVSAQFVRYDVRTPNNPERTTVRALEPAGVTVVPVKTPGRPPARNILIVVDTDSMEPGDGLLARQEAAKFIDKLAADDRVGIVTIPWMASVVTMTKNRDQARAALQKVITGAERYRSQYAVGLAEALDVERGDARKAQEIVWRNCCRNTETYEQCLAQPAEIEGCIDIVHMEIRQTQLEAHLRGQRSVDALRDLAESLRGIDGPKTMVFITGGTPPPDMQSVVAYSRLNASFAAAQISLYTLYTQQERVVNVKERATVGDRDGTPLGLADTTVERAGAENATGAANGIMMDVVGTYDKYFDTIVTELSGAYIVGIEVQASDRDGRTHQVSVKVNRKGADVRARNHYVIEPARTGSETGAAAGVSAAIPRPPAPVVTANPARDLAATPADVQPLVERMSEYSQGYAAAFVALLSEERAELKVSKWGVAGTAGGWTVESQRRLGADNLLVKRPGSPGWTVVRDVFQVDSQLVRERDNRLRTMFLEAPDTILQRGSEITAASAAQDIGFVDRRTNVATGPLVIFDKTNLSRFVFAKQAEQVTVAGVAATQLAFAEHGEPGLVRGQTVAVPVSGTMWADPRDGTILRTVVRWEVNGTTAEITVDYAKGSDGSMWVPAQMVEKYDAGSARLECVTKFSNYRKYVDTAK